MFFKILTDRYSVFNTQADQLIQHTRTLTGPQLTECPKL
jgi:hypothetical protein